jgi:hypothetical protein
MPEEKRIWGYTAPDLIDPWVQSDVVEIRLRAEQMDGALQAIYVERAGDIRLPWGERMEFLNLLQEMQKGDHLLIPDFRCLDWKYHGIVEATRSLVSAGLHLHVLRFGGDRLDVPPDSGRLFANILEGALEVFVHQHRMLCENARRARESPEVAVGGAPSLGKRRVRTAEGYRDVWCPKQCELLREIKRRRDAGESYKSIAEDFLRRRLRRGSGAAWARRIRKKGKDAVDASHIAKAWRWYNALLARGEDLGA